SEAADLTVRLGGGPRSAARCESAPSLGRKRKQKVMTTIETATVSRAFRALSLDDLRRVAPSVFAEQARPGVSSRYTFVSTAQVVDLLRGEGWEPVKATQQRVRLENRQGF